jgi:ferric-dicitrate binding protein FerR (iron transport regulator)
MATGQEPKHGHDIAAARHQTAEHIAHVQTGTPISQMIVVGLIVVVLAGVGIWWLNRKSEGGALNTLFVSKDARNIATVNGQRGDITLSDSTVVRIGPATKLIIIPEYNERYRGIRVEGTAAVSVGRSNTPLEVRVGNAAVVARSTAFVVRGYPDEDEVFIKLTEGNVYVRVGDTRRDMTAPSAIQVAKDGTISEPSADAIDQATMWADGKVVFRNLPLKDVLPRFDKYYALKMKVADDAILSRSVTMEAEIDSKLKAIAALEKSAMVKFGYDGTTPMLRDAPAKRR